MNENISPEEKLLRLIRGEKKPKTKNIPVQNNFEQKSRAPQEVASRVTAKNPANFLAHHLLTFNSFRRLLPFLMSASIIYLIASIIYPYVGLKKIALPVASKEKFEEPLITPKEEPKPYEFYLEGVKQRKIFATPQTQVAATSAGVETASIKDLNLVGIIAGNNPQAIIEDKKAQKTYYLTKGQLVGDFLVEDILEGKITLSGKGQKFDLHI